MISHTCPHSHSICTGGPHLSPDAHVQSDYVMLGPGRPGAMKSLLILATAWAARAGKRRGLSLSTGEVKVGDVEEGEGGSW